MGHATVDQLRTLRAAAEQAKAQHGEHSQEHLDAYGVYAKAAGSSAPAMVKSVFVEMTSH